MMPKEELEKLAFEGWAEFIRSGNWTTPHTDIDLSKRWSIMQESVREGWRKAAARIIDVYVG